MKTTIELVTYKLKSGVSKSQLEATHEAVNNFLADQDGFYYRSCSEDNSGLIYDVVYWQTMQAAKSAGEAFMNHPAGQSLMALCDESSVNMQHMEVLTEKSHESLAA